MPKRKKSRHRKTVGSVTASARQTRAVGESPQLNQTPSDSQSYLEKKEPVDLARENRRFNTLKLLTEREEFCLIALTGRVGSGCSQAAEIFSSSTKQMHLTPFTLRRTQNTNEDRDNRTIYDYYSKHWLPFDLIRVRTIITSFLLSDKMDGFFFDLLELEKKNDSLHDPNEASRLKRKLLDEMESKLKDCFMAKRAAFEERKPEQLFDDYNIKIYKSSVTNDEQYKSMWSALVRELTKDTPDEDFITAWKKVGDASLPKVEERSERNGQEKLFEYLYKSRLSAIDYKDRNVYCDTVNRALYVLSARNAYNLIKDKGENVWEELSRQNDCLQGRKVQDRDFEQFAFVHDVLPTLSSIVHEWLIKGYNKPLRYRQHDFTNLFQKYGNCIRRFGRIIFDNQGIAKEFDKAQEDDIYGIPRKINEFIKVLRHPFSRSFDRPTRVVIDSLKNNFEATYLRDRYSAFYLFAISTDESKREKRLLKKNLNMEEIRTIDWNEYSTDGQKIYMKHKDDEDIVDEMGFPAHSHGEDEEFSTNAEKNFTRAVKGEGKNSATLDLVRKQAYEEGTQQFVLQDVKGCIENADVFISNSGEDDDLKMEIIRNVCLILHPGLVQPTMIERCMQIAFAAKANSGCLSRQVGAIVTDAQYNILSIGWNDVPCGDITCGKKNLCDLFIKMDQSAYSSFELDQEDVFHKRMVKYNALGGGDYIEKSSELLCGLPLRYCFKDFHKAERDPMRSRAMHAEEKAMDACGGKCFGGCLFTTSSPCEMCSKKAKNNGIKKIYYIEPYPGISEKQYSGSGDEENRATHYLFSGAIGRAYTQMYTPIVPYKDLLRFLGVKTRVEDK